MATKNCGPFLRGKRARYYCWIEGKLRSLRTDRPKVAEARYRAMLAGWGRERPTPGAPTVRECLDAYLGSTGKHRGRGKELRTKAFESFCAETKCGELPWDRVTTGDAEAWAAGHPTWCGSTRRTVLTYLSAAFNFCVRRKLIPESPLRGIVRPPHRRRRAVMSPEDEAALLAAATGPFLSILTALRETGARPSELCNAVVGDYRDGRIVLARHKSDSHGEDRVIYLPAGVKAEAERLIGRRTEGPIWRNTRGSAWTPQALQFRFTRLREKLKLGDGVFPYAFRHRFASRAINDTGTNPAMVARLLGHADMTMVMRHYFREDPEAAMKALEEIRKGK